MQEETGLVLNSYTTVVDAKKCKMYMRNFGEFFNNQVEYAGAIILSRTDIVDEAKAVQAMELLREINPRAAIITTPIKVLGGKKLLEVMEHPVSLEEELLKEEVCPECGHIHEHHHEHHHGHEEECHEHHHEHEEECHEHHHGHEEECHEHHHSHDGECHEHHHSHDGECHEHHHDHGDACGCGHHHEHGHHHADEVFTSWGRETVKKFDRDGLKAMLDKLAQSEEYGIILRAKGMLPAEDGTWIYFDMSKPSAAPSRVSPYSAKAFF